MKHLLRLFIRLFRVLIKGILLPTARLGLRLTRRLLRTLGLLLQRTWQLLQDGRYAAFGQRP